MTPTESKLLALIFADTLAAEKLPRGWYPPMTSEQWQRVAPVVFSLPEIGVRISPAWLGRDGASRQARSRGLRALESAGLVKLFAQSGRLATHVKLTPAGRKFAKVSAETPAQPATDAKGSAR